MIATLLAASASALQPGGKIDFQFDPVEHWAARIVTWAVLVALAVVAYALLRAHRGQLHGAVGKGLLLVGVILLPSFSVATGMLLVLSRAGQVEFCGSCHRAMRPFVQDMTDPAGESLAAVHLRYRYIPTNQCYECHTSYGLFGGFEAKIHGMGEVFRYYSGTYSAPITMSKPYPKADCLKCHGQSEKWLALDVHVDDDSRDDLLTDSASCMDCHSSGHLVVQQSAEEQS